MIASCLQSEGPATAVLTIAPVDDPTVEGAETVILTTTPARTTRSERPPRPR